MGVHARGLYGDACGPLDLSREANGDHWTCYGKLMGEETVYLLALRSLLRKAPGLVNGVLPCTAPGCLAE